MISASIFGSILILIGVALLLNSLFGIVLPIFRLMAGAFLIYWGITTLVDISSKHSKINTIFSQNHIPTPSPHIQTYNTIFGTSTIDFTDEECCIPREEIDINTVCGSSRIILPETINYEIEASGALSSIELPKGKAIRGFGSARSFRSDCDNAPTLRLNLHGSLSSIIIEVKDGGWVLLEKPRQ